MLLQFQVCSSCGGIQVSELHVCVLMHACLELMARLWMKFPHFDSAVHSIMSGAISDMFFLESFLSL